MRRTGSNLIAEALLSGRGLVFGATGVLILVTSAIAHANFAHILAALIFSASMVGLRELSRLDTEAISTPWAVIVRFTDLLSLLLLCVATFGPLIVMSLGGHVGWDVPMLAGVLIVWWVALDALVADYRRVLRALVAIALAWSPVVLLHPTIAQITYVVAGMATLALAYSIWSVRRTLKDVPRQYAGIDSDLV